MTNIGLFIQGGHLLSNGITQQGHYTKLTLESCGYTVDLLSTSEIESYKQLGHSVRIVNLHSDVSKYNVIIFVSALLSSDNKDNVLFLSKLKESGCKLVNLVCGNIFFLYQEEIIFDVHHVIQSNKNDFIDEIWILPMYKHCLQLAEAFFKIPVKIAPYVWNSDILKSFISEGDVLPYYHEKLNNESMHLLCAEPNMSVHKNAFVPMLIAESYENKYENLSKLCILCGDNLHINDLKKYLNILTNNKCELYKRIAYHSILQQFIDKNNIVSVVSHQYLNELNFFHFETLFLGWPLIHNCNELMNVGYYYDSHNVSDASLQTEYARMNHSRNHDVYMQNVHTFLEKYDPKNKIVNEKYKILIDSLLSENKS